MSGQKPRQIAVRVLQGREGGKFAEALLDAELTRSPLSSADRGLCQELVFGVVRWQATLDWLIGRKTGDRPQRSLLRDLLRLGLYQIFWLDRIPDHAAVHETVELARQHGLAAQAGFVNAVLRGYLREAEATREVLKDLKNSQPALGFSHPDWLVGRWQQRFSQAQLVKLLEWNNVPARPFARLNKLRTESAALQEIWRTEQVEFAPVDRDWLAGNSMFELKSHPTLHELPSFQKGFFYVQDPATLLAVRELGPVPGETVLDLCAAPGGKLSCLAQLMNNQGRLFAHDTAPERMNLIAENCARLGVTCVQTFSPAAFEASPAIEFDRILIDAPCSNTGVIRRRVDLRWRVRWEEIERLRRVQLQLLKQAAPLLKRGGTLVYSTCSLEPEENEKVVEQFIRDQPNFELVARRELLPFADATDGAFVAKLARL